MKNRVGGVAVDQLRSIVSRVEKLEEEKSSIAADIRDVLAEAKGNGFNVKAIKTILKRRKMDAQEIEENETILDVYLRALGMLPELDDDNVTPIEARAIASPDALYDAAVLIVARDRKASTSYIQRMLEIGYNRAATIIEHMERQGVVSAADHLGKRDVLIDPPEKNQGGDESRVSAA